MTLDDFISKLADMPEAGLNATLTSVQWEGAADHAQDNLLQTLLNEYTQAQTNFDRVIKDYGETSAMAELARDMRDSAKASVETRLNELQITSRDLTKYGQMAHYDPEISQSLDTAKKLKERQDIEILKQQKLEEQRQKDNSDLADDAILAFLLLALFSRRREWSGQFAPFIDVALSFSEVAGKTSS